MKKIVIIGGIVAAVLIGYIGVFQPLATASNNLVKIDQQVELAVGGWQSQLQRRADLLPNLANTAQAAGNLEKDTQTQVAQARAAVSKISQLNPLDIANNADLQKQLVEAQAQASAAQVRVNAAVEATPNLKSTELFRDTMKAIEGTENRIQTARYDSIRAINEYNTYIRLWPGSFAATIFGYHKRPNFQATSQVAPELFTK